MAQDDEPLDASVSEQARLPTPTPRIPRARIVARLWRAAERQVEEIEMRIAVSPSEGEALERDAKTLAIIARTVRELVTIDAQKRNSAPAKESARKHGKETIPADAEGDVAPRDIEAFRRELARRLDQLRGGGEGAGSSGEV